MKDEWVDCLELGNTYLELTLKETNKPIKTQDIRGTPLPVQLNIYGASNAIVNFNLNRDYSHPRPTTWEEFFNAAGSESMNSARFRIFVDGVPRVISLDIPDTCLIRRAFQITIPGSKHLSD